MSEYEFPIRYELIIQYTDKNGDIKSHTIDHDNMNDAIKSIRHFRVNKNCEILKYIINPQRVLL